ncbi:MAG: TrkA family potassium uptake protein [Chloroflexi bacterium]|nr:TrkA family potassium uptake protein [Chloroflexota bacterium]
MNIIVVGCGRMGAELAYRLYQRGHDVAVIDANSSAFNHLPADFQGRFYEGDALSYDVLHRAGIEHSDSVAAVTNSDALNLVIAQTAKVAFHVHNVVARNYDPNCRELYEVFNIQVISATGWAAQRLEEMIYHSEIRTVFSAGNGEVEVYELKVPANMDGKPLQALLDPTETVPVSLTRAGKSILPAADFVLQENDIVHISATLDGITALRQRVGFSAK